MLSINGLTKKFDQKIVLDALSLTIKKGEIALLLGESGVGKSTLLRILSNLENADEGTISFNDTIIDADTANRAHIVGMVFQQFNLFDHLTVVENVMLALEKVGGKNKQVAHGIASTILARYGLRDKLDCYPPQLSGGQKQRVALARALAMKPSIVCLDEPTSALDPQLTTHVANTIQQLAIDNYVVLVASHDIGLLARLECTIYLMHDGKIVEKADSRLFNQNAGAYSAIQQFIAGTPPPTPPVQI